MSIEAGVVVSKGGKPIHWHLPPGRNAGYLPDSPDLWSVFWENRQEVLGFAHSHPGSGQPSPSWEDLTTFSAVEQGLGRRLVWWITSRDYWVYCYWAGPGPHDYSVNPLGLSGGHLVPSWLEELKGHSNFYKEK